MSRTPEPTSRCAGTAASQPTSICDGHTDLYVTSAGYNVPTDGSTRCSGTTATGRSPRAPAGRDHAPSAGTPAPRSATSNGDGRPDLFVACYTDPNFVIDSAAASRPTTPPCAISSISTRDRTKRALDLPRGRPRAAGIEQQGLEHGLGAVFTDFDGDGRLDLYVANDADPNQLYRNVRRRPADLGFRFEDVAKRFAVDDPNAGMGIAAADYSGDGRIDLFVTNSRGQLHAAYRSPRSTRARYVDVRPDIAAVLGTDSTAWGDSWADLDLDGDLDLVLANGAIPVANLAKDARRVQILENVARPGKEPRFALVRRPGSLERLA